MKLTFEDSIDIINEEIGRQKRKWMLDGLQWLDYDDISQLLRLHIHKKWDMWDQTRPIRPWLYMTINNQIKNHVRNHYRNFSRPCLACSYSEGGDSCSLYGTQNTSCNLYASWTKKKKSAHDIKLPVPIEYHVNEVSEMPAASINFDESIKLLHSKLVNILKPLEYTVFKFLYIDGKEESELIDLMIEETGTSRANLNRQLKAIKEIIYNQAKVLIYNEGIINE